MIDTPRYRAKLSLFWFLSALCIFYPGLRLGNAPQRKPLILPLDPVRTTPVTSRFRAERDATYVFCYVDQSEVSLRTDMPVAKSAFAVTVSSASGPIRLEDKGGLAASIGYGFTQFRAQRGVTYDVTARLTFPCPELITSKPRLELAMLYWECVQEICLEAALLYTSFGCLLAAIFHGIQAARLFNQQRQVQRGTKS